MAVQFNEWDFRGKRLEGELGSGDFVTSESTLILVSSEATLGPTTLADALAVGVAQDMTFNQNRQVIQVFEIGSNQKYTISSGRTNGQLSLSRVLFDGPSLLKTLAPTGVAGESGTGNPHDVAGHGRMFTNLASSLFSRPIGLMMVFRDLETNNIGGVFFEEVFVASHNMNVSANSPFIGEGVSMLYNSVVPLNLAAAS